MPDPLLYAPVGHPLNSCPSTSCPQQTPRIRCCWSRTPSLHGRKAAASCSLLCPHTPPLDGPLGPSPPQKAAALLAGSSTCMDAQRSYELHRVTNLPWLEVQVGKMKSSSIEMDAMGVQMPSLPQRGLLWIIRPSTPVEELAPSGTGIISLQCAAQESVIHPLKYLVTANHNTAS